MKKYLLFIISAFILVFTLSSCDTSDLENEYHDFHIEYNDEGWLFTRDDGQMLHPGTYLFWLDKVLKQANLPHFTIHSLRHTNITLQILSGVPLVTVAGRAGHSRTSTTTDIYSHYVQTSDAVAAEKLDQAFSVKKVEKPKTSDIDDILALKKEAKENGFDSITEYIRFLRQSL